MSKRVELRNVGGRVPVILKRQFDAVAKKHRFEKQGALEIALELFVKKYGEKSDTLED